jgi:hypothetical protein
VPRQLREGIAVIDSIEKRTAQAVFGLLHLRLGRLGLVFQVLVGRRFIGRL